MHILTFYKKSNNTCEEITTSEICAKQVDYSNKKVKSNYEEDSDDDKLVKKL
jgi:hypothetical protein